MNLVQTITLTQEYIDDTDNYIIRGGATALKVLPSSTITKESWIVIIIPCPDEWRTSKPALIVGINSLGAADRTILNGQIAPTAYWPNSGAYIHAHFLGDCWVFDSIICKYYQTYFNNEGITRKVYSSTDTTISEIDIYFSDSSLRLPANTVIKIYS